MKAIAAALSATALMLGLAPAAASAAQGASSYRNAISNDMRQCAPGAGPAVRVTVRGIKSATGKIRVQSYRGIKSEWLKKGRWLHRIDVPVTDRNMTFCMPIDQVGTYGIAVRHDVNGNGKTEISKDGGGMSNNPSINIFNLGKPSYKKTAISVGNSVKSISIRMRYM